jgi:hypothetical protein
MSLSMGSDNMTMRFKQIPKKKLIKGRWYIGRGRNSNLGFWDGEFFITIGVKWGSWTNYNEPYYEEKTGCFQPYLLVDEGKIIPLGKEGWDAHYGIELILDKETKKNTNPSTLFYDKDKFDTEVL